MSDYLSRMQQIQNATGVSTTTGIGDISAISPSASAANADIWTQAAQLENKYKAQLQLQASIDPLQTSKVMDNFMNEALDMLFATMGTSKGSSSTQISIDSSSISSTSTTSDTSTTSTTSTTSDTNTPKITTDTISELDTDGVKKYKAIIDSDIKRVNDQMAQYGATDETIIYTGGISQAMSDTSLTLEEKTAIVKYYKDAIKKAGFYDGSANREQMLANEVYDKFSSGSMSVSDTIDMLKVLNEMYGKGYVITLTKGNANFTSALYLKAQKEGKLADALKVAPATESIQKQMSFGTETNAITSLLTDMNKEFTTQLTASGNNYGLTEARRKELDAKFESIIQPYKLRTVNAKNNLQKTVFPEIFDSGNYSKNEKMYLLQKAFKECGYANVTSQKTEIENFVEAFRDMSSEAQEKYFTSILNAYANVDVNEKAQENTSVDSTNGSTTEKENTGLSSSVKIKNYTDTIEDKLTGKYAVSAQTPVKNAMNDDSLTINEKVEILSYYHKRCDELGVNKKSAKIEEGLATQICKKLQLDPNYSVSDAISALKQIDNLLGTDKKGVQKHVMTSMDDAAMYAADLYVRAQKEGKLAQALEVAPVTPAVQKNLSFGTETKAISSLVSSFDSTAKAPAQQGLTAERKNAIKIDAEAWIETLNPYKVRGSSSTTINCENLMKYVFSECQYNKEEKIYFLETVIEGARKLGKKDQDPIDNFVENYFRTMHDKQQEEYLTKLFDLYASIKIQ